MNKNQVVLAGLLAVILVPTNSVAQPCVDPPPGLIAWWTGDDANDVAGANHTVFNGGVLVTSGMVGQALFFDGLNDYVQTPLSSNSLPLTLEFWFKTGSDVSGEQSIVDSDIGGSWGHSVILGYNSGDRTIDIQYHNGQADTGVVVSPNTWYHVGVVFSDRLQAYIDGQLKLDQPYSPPGLDGNSFRFGRHNAGDPQWFNGLVDEVSIYNRALTQSEIQAIYNAGSAGKCAELACDGVDDNANGVVDEGCYPGGFCDTELATSWVANIPANDCSGPIDGMGRSWFDSDFDDSSWTSVTLPNQWSGSDRYYRGTFSVAPALQSAFVQYSSDDKITLYVNGVEVARHGSCHGGGCVNALPGWGCAGNEIAAPVDITSVVVPGSNVLAAWVTNGGNFARFTASITASFDLNATEICDGGDNQCPGHAGYGLVDEGCDADGDGYCAAVAGASAACPNGGSDCDDSDPERHPGAVEICDGLDDDCNGTTELADGVGDPWRDTDGDGLYDCWEVYGIDGDVTTPGVPAPADVDLALHEGADKADRRVRDLYVEVDWMNGGPFDNDKPQDAALQAITDAFWNNSETGKRIGLHWMMSEEVPHESAVGLQELNKVQFGDPVEYGNDPTIACGNPNAYVGTSAERAASNCPGIMHARSWSHRYALFSHGPALLSGDKPTGDARVFADTCGNPLTGKGTGFIVYMAGVRRWVDDIVNWWPASWSSEYADWQAGTIMHELGHTINLHHGGDSDTDCKPNYLSVMNYARQFDNSGIAWGLPDAPSNTQVRLGRDLDYSRAALGIPDQSEPRPHLAESMLDENAGIGGPSNERVMFGVAGSSSPVIGPATGPIDWNVNGILESPVSGTLDVNSIPLSGECPGVNELDSSMMPTDFLLGHDDWATVLSCLQPLQAPQQGGALLLSSLSLPGAPMEFTELTVSDYLNGALGGIDVDSDGVINIDDRCPLAADTSQEDADADLRGDACDCLPLDPNAWQAPPSEVPEILFIDAQNLSWSSAPIFVGASSTQYDTLRSANPSDFSTSITCIESGDGLDMQATDADTPALGQAYYYLVRAENACPDSEGPLGVDSSGIPRPGVSCP